MSAITEQLHTIRKAINRIIVGQEPVTEQVLASALAGGNVLLEGVPGLGKTELVKTFAQLSGLSFARIQFTPDLMPADVTGSHVFHDESGFTFQPGPVFTNVLLADEINRATPKTQSALLEAMQERAVTTGGERRTLPEPFLVLATQNPLEMEGTYPLPEAQLDRFLLKIVIERPSREALMRILSLTTGSEQPAITPVLPPGELLRLQRATRAIPLADSLTELIVELVERTHHHPAVRLGASPRGAQALVLVSKAFALLAGRSFVEREDFEQALLPALRHRILLTFDAELDGTNVDTVLSELRAALPA